MKKSQALLVRDRLIDFANRIGYSVELESMMEGAEEYDDEGNVLLIKGTNIPQSPAGDCNYIYKRIRIRAGKGINGQVATLIHELAHVLGLGGFSVYSALGTAYTELAAESITELVTQTIGIDRSLKTAKRIATYGFTGYLISPVTLAIANIICEQIKDI